MRHVHALTIPKGGRTCPFLALSIPGERPFVVRTDVYKAVIKGIHVTDTSLEKIKHEKFGDIWALTILLNKREWSDESARAFWAEWYAHKHDRKVLAEVAGQVLKHKTSSRAAYERLNVLGYRFKKYGQVTDYERRLLKVEFEDYYWKAL